VLAIVGRVLAIVGRVLAIVGRVLAIVGRVLAIVLSQMFGRSRDGMLDISAVIH
jgi:uncharacterized membrane protein